MDLNKAKLSERDLISDTRLEAATDDKFNHVAIAGRVAELALSAKAPCNIALFGPWGSGKSSFFGLLNESVRLTTNRARIVRYDAWKFGGQALKRNFIAHAAKELGIDKQLDDLYHSTETVSWNLKRTALKALPILAALFALVLLYAALFGWLDSGDSYWHLAWNRLADLAALSPLGAAVVLVGGLLRESAKVTVSKSSPSEDEEFADRFAALVEQAKSRHGLDRLIFFIDELDRCSKEDVVATLTSVRTFLDQKDCIFIVAADRDVLESALTKLEQSNPVREDAPYYSSASEFLDKIFQHQVALPPLRSNRLTGFARSLVSEVGGVWQVLREHDTSTLNDVLYTLIPAHVRSPRRVKVLLNNFATNARIAEAREIAWVDRATEVAFLTVLQTEYPRVAADLHLEPRLPSLLLNPPENPSDRQRALLDKHGFDQTPPSPATLEDVGPDVDDASPPSEPDRLLIGTDNQALRKRQREDIRRYLLRVRAAHVPDPRWDLLYLESAGNIEGLADASLSQALEEDAASTPDEVLGKLADRSVAELLAAAQLLGRLSEGEFGRERANLMSVLARTVERVPQESLSSVAAELQQHILSFLSEAEMDDEMVAGFFALGVCLGSDAPLAAHVSQHPSLYDSESVLALAADNLDRIPEAQVVAFSTALLMFAESDASHLVGVFRKHDADVIGRVLKALGTTLKTSLDAIPEDEECWVAAALDALCERGDELAVQRLELARLSVGSPRAYPDILECLDALISPTATWASNRLCLTGLCYAETEDWSQWSDTIQEPAESDSGLPNSTNSACQRILREIGDTATAELAATLDAATAAISTIAEKLELSALNDKTIAAAKASLPALVGTTALGSDDATAVRCQMLKLFQLLIDKGGETLGSALSTAIDESLPQLVPTTGWTAEMAGRAILILRKLPTEQLRKIVEELQGTAFATPLDAFAGKLVIAGTRELRVARGADIACPPVETLMLVLAQPQGSTSAVEFLDLTDDPADVIAILEALPGADLSHAVGKWATLATVESRVSIYLAMFKSGQMDKYRKALAGDGKTAAEVARALIAVMSKPGIRAPQRDSAVQELAALADFRRDDSEVAKAVVAVAERFLDPQNTKTAVEHAARLLSSISLPHGSKTRLQTAVKNADQAGVVSELARSKLTKAGLLDPKKKRKLLGIIPID